MQVVLFILTWSLHKVPVSAEQQLIVRTCAAIVCLVSLLPYDRQCCPSIVQAYPQPPARKATIK